MRHPYNITWHPLSTENILVACWTWNVQLVVNRHTIFATRCLYKGTEEYLCRDGRLHLRSGAPLQKSYQWQMFYWDPIVRCFQYPGVINVIKDVTWKVR